RTLDFLTAQPITLVASTLELLLYRQSHFQRHGSDRVHEQLADRLINRATVHQLAYRLTGPDTPTLAHVVGHAPFTADLVSAGHAFTANCAHRESLQQSWPLARGASFALTTQRLRV